MYKKAFQHRLDIQLAFRDRILLCGRLRREGEKGNEEVGMKGKTRKGKEKDDN